MQPSSSSRLGMHYIVVMNSNSISNYWFDNDAYYNDIYMR